MHVDGPQFMNVIRWARSQWDRVFGVTFVVIGGIAILVGWHGVSQEGLTAQQIPYVISGGVGGLFLLGVGGILWLSADLRDEWRKLDAIERAQAPAEPSAVSLATDDPFSAAPMAVLPAAASTVPVKARAATKPHARATTSKPRA